MNGNSMNNTYCEDQRFIEFEEKMDRLYSSALDKAIKRSQEDGYWEEIKTYSPEDICIELEGSYPELFEEYEKFLSKRH